MRENAGLLPILGCLLVLGILAFFLESLPSVGACTLIRFRRGLLEVRRGEVRTLAREHIAEILREAGVSNASIAVTRDNRVAFSRSIPAPVRQRLRNVILNQ